MTLTKKLIGASKIKKFIPYLVLGKLVFFSGFIIYMMKG
tara:strand:+ start:514 stop:630 length:117 start_codon:yes stop_codon:yes gene_type:complete